MTGLMVLFTSIIMSGCTAPGKHLPVTLPDLFTNITGECGLAGVPSFRLAVADINGDAFPDLITHAQSDETTGDVLDKQFVYLNVPGDEIGNPHSRKYIDFTEESNIRANRDGNLDGRHSSSAIFGDVDNDGDLDMFTVVYVHRNYTLNLGTNELLLNDGSGHFSLAPESPFHTEPIYNTATEQFFDFNNDGNLDIFIGNWYFNDVLSMDHLYMGHGDGTFSRVTESSGISAGRTALYGSAVGDYNNDGFMDIFLASYSHTAPGATNILWKNNGDGTFSQVQDETEFDGYHGEGSRRASFGVMPRDFDRDGDIDFLEVMTHGNGDGGGEHGIHSTTVANVDGVFSWDFFRVWGRTAEDPDIHHHGDHFGSWLDYDNDGLVDFALTESGYDNDRFYMFQQLPDHTFRANTTATGLHLINENGLPPGNVIPLDFDRDGDEDLFVGFGNHGGVELWRNNVGNLNNWLSVKLVGAGQPGYSNKSGIGARVIVRAGETTWTRELYAGNGHQGPQVPLSMTFGMGQVEHIDSITVRWPNSRLDTLTDYQNIPVNQFIIIEERSKPD